MTDADMAKAVESCLSGDWQCQACLEWVGRGSQAKGSNWGPWCWYCWAAWGCRKEHNTKLSLEAERASFQRTRRTELDRA